MNIFLSYNRRDRVFVSSVATRLRSVTGINRLFFDEEEIMPGNVWTEKIEEALQSSDGCVIFLGETGIGEWQNKEILVALDRHSKSPEDFKIITVILPHSARDQVNKNTPWFLIDIQWIEFANETDADAFLKLSNSISDNHLIPPEGTVPYMGLDRFDVEDAPFFFGRTFDVNWVFYKKLQLLSGLSSRFLAVVGDSGSGKSSFARAGLLATLKAGRFPGSADWTQVIFTPEDSPILKLATALQSAGVIADAAKFETDILSDRAALRRALEVYGARIVVLADQFEELITQCRDNPVRQAFLDSLSEAFKSQFLVCIITLRSDFYAAFSPFKEFADQMESNNYMITSLDFNTAGEEWEQYLRSIIQKPARLLGVQFEPVLTTQIIEDCKKINGILPALQLALVGLWKKRKDPGRIQSSDYHTLANGKGIGGIIETHANSILTTLVRDHPEIYSEQLIKAIFIRLVEITSNKEDVRKTVNKDELIRELGVLFGESKVGNMLVLLSGPDTRLIRIKKDESNENISWVEVIHEVLIRQWDQLRKWINERRDAIQYKDKLEEYIGDGNDLLKGQRLRNAEKWMTDNKDLQTLKITDFLQRSRKQINKKKYIMAGAFGLILVLMIVTGMILPVIKCRNCLMVKDVEKYGNYRTEDVHSLTLSGTDEIKDLRCFKHLDTLLLIAKPGEDFLSQSTIELLPKYLKRLTIRGYFLNDTILKFGSFSQLEALDITEVKGLRQLEFDGPGKLSDLTVRLLENFNSLQGIGKLSGLRALTLSDLWNVSNLSELQKLENLEALRLENLDGIRTLDGIEGLERLLVLQLRKLKVDTISQLHGMPALHTLEMSDLKIRSLAPIIHLPALETLELNDLGFVGDLGKIDQLPKLRSLRLNLRIDSVSVIGRCAGLRELKLATLVIDNLSFIEPLVNLQKLDLENLKGISNLDPVANAKSLRELAIENLPISDLDILGKLPGLREFSLSGLSRLSTLSGLGSLADLKSLTLKESESSNVPPISLPGNLEALVLQGVDLRAVSGIEHPGNLKTLVLINIPDMKDLSAVSGLKKLEALQLKSISSLQSLEGIGSFDKLRRLELSYLPLGSLNGIEKLKNLSWLSLEDLGKPNTLFIPELPGSSVIDSMKIFRLKLENLGFISSETKLNNLIYDNQMELPDRENEVGRALSRNRNTRFFNLSQIAIAGNFGQQQ